MGLPFKFWLLAKVLYTRGELWRVASVQYEVTGWRAGATYKQKCAGLAAAQTYCDDAREKGFFSIKVIDENGSQLTPEQIDALCAKGAC